MANWFSWIRSNIAAVFLLNQKFIRASHLFSCTRALSCCIVIDKNALEETILHNPDMYVTQIFCKSYQEYFCVFIVFTATYAPCNALLHPLYENVSNGICNGAKIRYQVHGYFIEKSIYARNNKMNLIEAGSVWNQFSFFFCMYH